MDKKDIENMEGRLTRDCLTRIREVRTLLDSIEQRVKNDWVTNELGEIQGVANILDCRLASLGVVRGLLRKMG